MSTSPGPRPSGAGPRRLRGGWLRPLAEREPVVLDAPEAVARSRAARSWRCSSPIPARRLNGRRDLTGCTVPGCRYGSSGLGLCMRHRSAWTTSGHPDPAAWATRPVGRRRGDHAQCGLPFCSLWTEHAQDLFCKAHQTRWRQQGRPDVEAFIERCLLAGRDRIDFCGLPPQLKLELQYAVQCRADQADDHRCRHRS